MTTEQLYAAGMAIDPVCIYHKALKAELEHHWKGHRAWMELAHGTEANSPHAAAIRRIAGYLGVE